MSVLPFTRRFFKATHDQAIACVLKRLAPTHHPTMFAIERHKRAIASRPKLNNSITH